VAEKIWNTTRLIWNVMIKPIIFSHCIYISWFSFHIFYEMSIGSCLLFMKLASLPYLIRSNFIKTTYDISLDSQISFLPLGFSPRFITFHFSLIVAELKVKERRIEN
jgi:hypothetical protein